MSKKGKIIKQISNLYTVAADGKEYECRARGKFRNDELTPLVGEFVVIDEKENYIMEMLPRKNFLTRPSIANVDIALIITSVKEPNLSLSLLDRQLICILNAGVEPIICFTKVDLLNKSEKKKIKKIVKYYKSIGISVITNKNLLLLRWLIHGKTVVLTGQTGAGKSTLLNKLDRRLNLNTSEISKSLGRGVHTTRHTELFEVAGAFIADTPGFSALDLNIEKEKLKTLYPEFKGVKCRYDNCNHVKENNCGVKKAVEDGHINKTRYDNYVKFWGEL